VTTTQARLVGLFYESGVGVSFFWCRALNTQAT